VVNISQILATSRQVGEIKADIQIYDFVVSNIRDSEILIMEEKEEIHILATMYSEQVLYLIIFDIIFFSFWIFI
jgi:hypothetical protein